ncbi:ubiquitin-associated domain-containing protein 2 [Rhinolophus ferrumequinum]|uniref:Ubiquitin-associated domain-containing protein 2 n=3 Tax=Rhinolophus ferrumequinum TaxID=59479 RepID=A0A671E6V8_RHIFE|nr:ubiquitin-associated domain-containing protein 2 [Rhinolophus ferrumequinum]
MQAALGTGVWLPGGTPLLLLHDPIAFPKGARARRKNPKRRNLPLRTHFPFQAGREGAAGAVRPTGRACALHRRPLEGNRVAGLTAPPGVRLRGRWVPPPLLPLPLSPRRGSGSGGTMFTSTGSSGLYKAPLSKSLLLVPSALSLLLALVLPHCQRFFAYDLQSVKDDFQIWRLLCGRIICLDLKDTFCSSLLIYNFRIFERRYGSRKFASFLLGSWVLSALVDFILVETVWYSFGITASRNLPSGFLAPVFALFVPFYCSIPRVQVAQILGPLSITNKTLIYILGLQLFTSGSYIWIVAISGLISGVCYHSKMLQIHQVLCIPSWMAKFFSWTLEPIFSSSEPTTEARIGMGATVDIQRQQRMELLDRQLMLSQFAQARRQRQQQGGMINWNRLFPPLRQRQNINYQDGRRSEQQASPALEVSEEQVARLMEMGFSRGDALEALRASNNDLNVATNFLLQH